MPIPPAVLCNFVRNHQCNNVIFLDIIPISMSDSAKSYTFIALLFYQFCESINSNHSEGRKINNKSGGIVF